MAEIKKINTELQPIDKLLDTSGDAGTSGQILSTTGSGTNWIDNTGGGGTVTGTGANEQVTYWTNTSVIDGDSGFKYNKSASNNSIITLTSTGLQALSFVDSDSAYADAMSILRSGDKLYLTYGHNANEEAMTIVGGTGSDVGYVGIGTTAPGAKLNVVGSGTMGWSDLANAFGLFGSTTAGIGIDDNEIACKGDMYFGTINSGNDIIIRAGGATQSMIVKSGGNVGIGTNTSPAYKLDVNGGSIFMDTDWPFYLGSTNAFLEGNSTGTIIRSNATAGFKWTDGGTTHMTLDTNGNLGIGTASPVNNANWAGLTLSGTTGGQIDFQDDGTTVGAIYNGTWGLAVTSAASKELRLYSSDTIALTLDSSQNAIFAGDGDFDGHVSVNKNNTSGVALTIGGESGNGIKTQYIFGGVGQYNWQIGTSTHLSQTLSITPSSATAGTTFTTPILNLDGSNNDATFAGNIILSSGSATIDQGAIFIQDTAGGRIGFNRNTTNGNIHNSNYNAFQLQSNTSGADGKFEIQAYQGSDGASGGSFFINKAAQPLINDYILHYGDENTKIGFSGSDTFIVHTGGTTAITVDGSQYVTFTGNIEMTGTGHFGAADNLYVGGATPGTDHTYIGDSGRNVTIYNGATFTVASGVSTFGGNTTFNGSVTIEKSTPTLKFNNLAGGGLDPTLTATGTDFTISTTSITPLTIALDTGNTTFIGQVTIPETPTANTHAASKKYVDDSISGAATYKATWDARTSAEGGSGAGGNPDLTASTYKTNGWYLIVSNAGSATPNGPGTEPDSWHVGDWVIWNDDLGASGEWQKIDNTSVISGAGTGQKVVKWDGSGTSETLADGPITFSTNDSTFAGNITLTGGQILTTGGVNLALNPNTGLVTVGGSIQTTGNDTFGNATTDTTTVSGILSVGANATFAGEISQIYDPGNTGAFQYLKNANSGSSAYISKKWQNDDAGFGEIWRNSSTRNAGTGNTVSSFNMYNSAAINFWPGGSLGLTLDASQNATFAGTLNIGASQKIYLGGSTARMHVYHTGSSGTANVLTKEGDLNLVNQSHGDDIVFKTEDSGGSVIQPLILDSGGAATFAGSVTATSFSSSAGASFDPMATIEYSDISTGENRGLRIINTSGTDQQWNITTGVTGSENESFCIRDATADVNALKLAISSGNATFAGSVTGTSAIFNGGVTVDGIYLQGTQIDLSSGTLEFDADAFSFLDGDATFAGNITFSSGSDIIFPDNLGAALEFKEGSNLYMRFVTTNGSEAIQMEKATTISNTLNVSGAATFAGNLTVTKASDVSVNLISTASDGNIKIDITPTGGGDAYIRTAMDANTSLVFTKATDDEVSVLTLDNDSNATFAGDINSTGAITGATIVTTGNAEFKSNVYLGDQTADDTVIKGQVTHETGDALGYKLYRTGGGTSLLISAAGDAEIEFGSDNGSGTNTTHWTIGKDNSDNSFRISNSAALGTSDALTIDTSENATFAANVTVGHDLKMPTSGEIDWNGGDVKLVGTADNIKLQGGSLSITGDGSNAVTLTESGSGDFTIDAPDDIRLDAGGNDIVLRASGTEFGRLKNDSSHFILEASAADKDIILRGTDNTTEIDALRLDMSEAGNATFAGDITVQGGDILNASGAFTITSAGDFIVDAVGDIKLDADGGDWYFRDAGSNILVLTAGGSSSPTFAASQVDADIIFKGNDGGSTITALTLDMSVGGSAYFNHDIVMPDNGKVTFGTGSDLQIYHDASNSYIVDTDVGSLKICAANFHVMNSGATEYMMTGTPDEGIILYYDNSVRFTTVGSSITNMTGGIAVTSTISGDDLKIELDHDTDASTGTVINIGQGSFTAGKIYANNEGWEEADAGDPNATFMLGLCVGVALNEYRLLLNGIYDTGGHHGFTIGSPLYISTTAGGFTETAPSGGDYARVVGYALSISNIYFCPDNTWVLTD